MTGAEMMTLLERRELREWAKWLQVDSAYLYRRAAAYRDAGGPMNDWMAVKVQENAANSARMSREQFARWQEAAS